VLWIQVVHWFHRRSITLLPSLFYDSFSSKIFIRPWSYLRLTHNAIVAQRANKRGERKREREEKRERRREQSVMVRRWFVEGAKLIQGWERHSFRPTKMSSKSGIPGKTGVTKRPAGIRGPRDSEEAKERDETEGERSGMSRRKGGDVHPSQTAETKRICHSKIGASRK